MTDFYETREQVSQYLSFHYGEEYFGVPNYPRVCAERCLALAGDAGRLRALDLGCAVGRTTLELARSFREVVGVDLSSRFIEAARELQDQGELIYHLVEEGDIARPTTARLEDLGLAEVASRVTFEVADAAALPDHHTGYDLVFAGNLIDRLHDPGAFLEGIGQCLNPGGYLVISSPYTLLEAFTPRENWIGGFYREGKPVTVLEGMKHSLEPRFEPVGEPEDIPFVIRETRRKFQHTIAQLTAWRKRTD